MFDLFDPPLSQSPVVDQSGHGRFPIGLVVLFIEVCGTDDKRFFVAEERYPAFHIATPALGG